MNTPPTAAKRGRPRTRPDGLLRHRLDLTAAESERARAAATVAGQSLSEFFRGAVLAALPPEKVPPKKSGNSAAKY